MTFGFQRFEELYISFYITSCVASWPSCAFKSRNVQFAAIRGILYFLFTLQTILLLDLLGLLGRACGGDVSKVVKWDFAKFGSQCPGELDKTVLCCELYCLRFLFLLLPATARFARCCNFLNGSIVFYRTRIDISHEFVEAVRNQLYTPAQLKRSVLAKRPGTHPYLLQGNIKRHKMRKAECWHSAIFSNTCL